MSLDVYLIADYQVKKPQSSGIFVRENGVTKEITREEWDKLSPDREPVRYIQPEETTNVLYHSNITHNMGHMATEAQIYDVLWRPDEIGLTKAHEIVSQLWQGLQELRNRPDVYKKYNPENNWGSYESLVEFVQEYLIACIVYPDAKIEVSR